MNLKSSCIIKNCDTYITYFLNFDSKQNFSTSTNPFHVFITRMFGCCKRKKLSKKVSELEDVIGDLMNQVATLTSKAKEYESQTVKQLSQIINLEDEIKFLKQVGGKVERGIDGTLSKRTQRKPLKCIQRNSFKSVEKEPPSDINELQEQMNKLSINYHMAQLSIQNFENDDNFFQDIDDYTEEPDYNE